VPDKGSIEDLQKPGNTSEVLVNVEEIENTDKDMMQIVNASSSREKSKM
jgi:hypothetical protein